MFTKIIVRHPYFVCIAVIFFCGTCLILPFTLRTVPQFSDPQVGFETRGTVISQRLTAWANLLGATKPSGRFVVDPREFSTVTVPVPLFNTTESTESKIRKINQLNQKNKRKKMPKTEQPPKVYVIATQRNFSDNVVKKHNQWKAIQELGNILKAKNHEREHLRVSTDKPDVFFCGTPDQRYSRVVVSSMDETSLFTYKSMMAMCHIEHQLIQNHHFYALCDTIKKQHCCHPWSVVNYVALLHNRTSCLAITEEDIAATLILLKSCSPFYHNLQLTHDCNVNKECQSPVECTQHNAVFNILHYLTDIGFLPPNMNNTLNNTHLTQSMIFLPIGCSTKTIDYYHDLERQILAHSNVKVVAMEFGLKSALFDHYLIRDTWLILAGILCVMVCMWIYTESLFLTITTMIAIIFSLGVSYFMYTLVFEMNFFPFMNLLAAVVVVGIGADDVFIFCKVWCIKKQDQQSSVVQLMSETFQHAVTSMLVTSLTTAAAFYASIISSITTICCFSVFAGTAIIANFFLMITWLPSCVIISERWGWSPTSAQCKGCDSKVRVFRSIIDRLWVLLDKMLVFITMKLRYFWLIFLTSIALGSLIIVLKYPGLQLPESVDFQLFQSSHPFEQYDLFYKQKFWYERQRMDSTISENYKLPLRFVWGILPEDNGNYFNPYSKGTLELDNTFDIADPLSQIWLLKFCRELRAQPFYLSALGPLLPNCFIESFSSWMQRRCIDPVDKIDRTPCCEIHRFPYERSIFEMCIVEAMSALYETPAEYYIPGIAGPKFAKNIAVPTVQAVVVEYDSTYSYSLSYNYMDRFYVQVENWTQEQMKNAPAGMRKGWFISELEFYDLQKVLSEGTIRAIGSAIGIAFLVLWFVTLNILISLYAIFSITCSIFTTMAILVLFGWKLNVLESIAVTTAMGLAVDYSLHYGISYKMCKDKDREACARQAISNMGGSTAMAALTTGAAGALMLPSSVLAYIQIGVFLVVVMSVSWVYSTFLFNALLSIAGPERNFGQFSYPFLRSCLSSRSRSSAPDENPVDSEAGSSCVPSRHKNNVLSETTLSTSSIYAIPVLESHELESLTDRNNDLIDARPGTSGLRFVSEDHSPSTISNITIVMGDEN